MDMNPTVENPAVYHFHGHKDYPDTMVLTEDDYLDFLVNISRDPSLIPPRVQQALAGTSLLFIGYSLNDTNFRVVFRSLMEYTKRSVKKKSVTVQIPDKDRRVVEYLTQYFANSGIASIGAMRGASWLSSVNVGRRRNDRYPHRRRAHDIRLASRKPGRYAALRRTEAV